jgi:hypothetical protein
VALILEERVRRFLSACHCNVDNDLSVCLPRNTSITDQIRRVFDQQTNVAAGTPDAQDKQPFLDARGFAELYEDLIEITLLVDGEHPKVGYSAKDLGKHRSEQAIGLAVARTHGDQPMRAKLFKIPL